MNRAVSAAVSLAITSALVVAAALGQYTDREQLVDPGLAEFSLIESSRVHLEAWADDEQWPEAGAPGSGWHLLSRLIGPTTRFREAAMAEGGVAAVYWHSWWSEWWLGYHPLMGDDELHVSRPVIEMRESLDRILAFAEREGIFDLIEELPRTRNLTAPPGSPSGWWLSVEAPALNTTVPRVLKFQLGRALRNDDVIGATTALHLLLDWERLMNEDAASPLFDSLERFVPARVGARPHGGMATFVLGSVLQEALDRGWVSGAESEAMLVVLSTDHTRKGPLGERMAYLARSLAIEYLIEHRIERGIDAPGEPGMATGPTPITGANAWLERLTDDSIFLEHRIIIIPTARNLDALADVWERLDDTTLDELIGLIAERELDSPDPSVDGVTWRASELRALLWGHQLPDLDSQVWMIRLLLEASFKRHGRYPTTLDELDHDLQRLLPVDPFAPDGRWVYRLVFDSTDWEYAGYMLYSVGLDGVDNGGKQLTREGFDGPSPTLALRPTDPDHLRGPINPNDWRPDLGGDAVYVMPPERMFEDLSDKVLYWPPGIQRPEPQAR